MPLQSLNLRAALFRCLNELKKNGTLGKEVIVRKTFFDDCKGERIQELLVSFSALVLRKVLTAGQGGRPCIAARLATAKTVTAKEQKSLLPLAVAHRASLTALLHNKKDLRERYKKFGRTLDAKEQELDRRFEAVVATQEFLDRKPIPDHTVARVSKLFEKNWQGDRKLVEVIAQGEEQEMKDSLLDKPFSETWLQVSTGTFEGATGTSWQGLLQDLDKRVSNQEARLTDWRNFREAMRRDDRALSAAKNPSPTLVRTRSQDPKVQKQRDLVFSPRKSPRKTDWKAGEGMNEESSTHPKQLRKENDQDEFKERDFVFSPRKSPRKSLWQVEDPGVETSPTDSQAALKLKETESMAVPNGGFGGITENPIPDQLFEKEKGDAAESSSHVSDVDDTDESGFSKISGGRLHPSELPDHAVRIDHSDTASEADRTEASSTPNNEKSKSRKLEHSVSDLPGPSNHSHTPFTEESSSATSDEDDSWISSLPLEGKQEARPESQSPNEDDILAEQIVSMTINALPTPAKPQASLMERTRQSMTFANLVGLQNLLPQAPSPTPLPRIPPKKPHPTTDPDGPTTLLERTRQSISLVPSKPKGSRKSMLDRRTSNLYPTNQFETPKRQQLDRVTERTPPEELFSPGAGYDSVFKSRPKIALSPDPSPRLGDGSETDDAGRERDGDERVGKGRGETSPRLGDVFETDDARTNGNGRVGKGRREASPLARMTARV